MLSHKAWPFFLNAITGRSLRIARFIDPRPFIKFYDIRPFDG